MFSPASSPTEGDRKCTRKLTGKLDKSMGSISIGTQVTFSRLTGGLGKGIAYGNFREGLSKNNN